MDCSWARYALCLWGSVPLGALVLARMTPARACSNTAGDNVVQCLYSVGPCGRDNLDVVVLVVRQISVREEMLNGTQEWEADEHLLVWDL